MDKLEQARNIVDELMSDLSDRRGFDLDDVDEEIRQEIRNAWEDIVFRGIGGSV